MLVLRGIDESKKPQKSAMRSRLAEQMHSKVRPVFSEMPFDAGKTEEELAKAKPTTEADRSKRFLRRQLAATWWWCRELDSTDRNNQDSLPDGVSDPARSERRDRGQHLMPVLVLPAYNSW